MAAKSLISATIVSEFRVSWVLPEADPYISIAPVTTLAPQSMNCRMLAANPMAVMGSMKLVVRLQHFVNPYEPDAENTHKLPSVQHDYLHPLHSN